jgi:uncharacterized membrane protein
LTDQHFKQGIELIGTGIDAAGVLLIVLGALVATMRCVRRLAQRDEGAYRVYRQGLGRAILLGLELLVAGDIIRTVVVDPTPQNVGVLALIVLIRTFLSWSLEVELEGRWPWQGRVGTPGALTLPAADQAHLAGPTRQPPA